ncbi:hypothetical protein B0T10DRAFT_542596 [Thelonectria olida]|uniref:Uncharacterized protein n=1 Tax=Thelonectria olida TaxID=1576542 RepID=A0A9P8WHV2_9HYPO|nr:hypothetical protein B0T10DRAFT_542596 [Thelonectria olida]
MAKKNNKLKAKAKANMAQEVTAPPKATASPKTPAPSKEPTSKKDDKVARKKMARCRKTPLVPPAPEATRPYNLQLSKERLEEQGFSPAICTKTPREVFNAWIEQSKLFLNRPTKKKYLAGKGRANIGQYSYSRLFIAFMQDHADSLSATNLRNVFQGWMPHGQAIGKILAADGYKTLESFAAADLTSWKAMSTSMALYDFHAHKFYGTPNGRVFLAIDAEYTAQQVMESRAKGRDRERAALNLMKRIISQIHDNCGPAVPCWSQEGEDEQGADLDRHNPLIATLNGCYPQPLVNQVRSLPHIEDLEKKAKKALIRSNHVVYQPLTQTALDGIVHLLYRIHRRGNMTQVLYLMNIPMLDRRLVAIILRACPQVTMVGIYDCPLIHFGDVIALLDLIHEINTERELKNLPKIKSLDFFPHYNSGIPYDHPSAAAYGVTWSEIPAEIAQRGIFRIILEAFLKAKEMKINLLFDEGKAFRNYLSKLPLLPMAVECFLDGLHRYCSLMQSRSSNGSAAKEAMFDILKSVRLGIKDMSSDSQNWYGDIMGKHLFFCSSCGHDMVEEFFTGHVRERCRPHTRVCAGCQLRNAMDTETHHQKKAQRDALSRLFKHWNPKDFNEDAPIHRSGETLLKLRTTENVRPLTPGMQVGMNGQLFQPRFMHELVRDNKIHDDSMQNLPTLIELMSEELAQQRHNAVFECMMIDLDRVTAHMLADAYWKQEGNLAPFGASRRDGGRPNSEDEYQKETPRELQNGLRYGWLPAAAVYRDLIRKGILL